MTKFVMPIHSLIELKVEDKKYEVWVEEFQSFNLTECSGCSTVQEWWSQTSSIAESLMEADAEDDHRKN